MDFNLFGPKVKELDRSRHNYVNQDTLDLHPGRSSMSSDHLKCRAQFNITVKGRLLLCLLELLLNGRSRTI